MNALQVEKTAMFLILTLIMLVAAFNIVSGLVMLVKDKTHDIAVLRTLGASRMMIIRIFLISGSSIGIFGTIIGSIIGISFAANIENIRLFLQNLTGVTLFDPLVYFLSFLPAKIAADDVGIIVIMSLSLSILATIYPAYRAAKLDPAIVLK
jgi:lipoprotein-releasing system permease protein